MIQNIELNELNKKLQDLMRKFDKQEIPIKEYHKEYHELMEYKAQIIEEILKQDREEKTWTNYV
jgi:polyribonucleotide nucleotidyltransferase